MCFSATASFVASAGLAGVSVATYKAADKKHKILATVPLLFAVQQGLEGIQWLLPHPGELCTGVGYSFLFFAFLFWPIYIPLVVSIVDQQRRDLLRWFIWFGAVVSAFLLTVMMVRPLDVQIYRHSIRYFVDVPFLYPMAVSYIFVVCGSLLVSTKPFIRFFGILLSISVFVSAIFFFETFSSVWCFFGAVLSSILYFYVRQQSKLSRQYK